MRPAHQAGPLLTACREQGFEPIALPTLSIEAVAPDPSVSRPVQGVAIFTSVNAVKHAASLGPLPWPAVQAHAIGPATQTALIDAGQMPGSTPKPPYTSEALVASLCDTATDQLVRGITIVTGEHSRSTMADSLLDAGFEVQVIAVYRRRCPTLSEQELIQHLSPLPDILCVPSNEALTNLDKMSGRLFPERHQLPLVLNNSRALAHARDLGFKGPAHVCPAAGDDAQLKALIQWRDSLYPLPR